MPVNTVVYEMSVYFVHNVLVNETMINILYVTIKKIKNTILEVMP